MTFKTFDREGKVLSSTSYDAQIRLGDWITYVVHFKDEYGDVHLNFLNTLPEGETSVTGLLVQDGFISHLRLKCELKQIF